MKLLKDVLQEWKREVEKKPPEMSVDQAYDVLGLKTGVGGYVYLWSVLGLYFAAFDTKNKVMMSV